MLTNEENKRHELNNRTEQRDGHNSAGMVSRERLMQAAIEFVAENGTSEFSVRKIAAGIGTSHRLLSYHFGNKEDFFKEIMNALEKKHAEELISFELSEEFDPDAALMRTWDYFTRPEILRYTKVYLELLVWRMRESPDQAAQRSGLGDSWREPLIELNRRAGVPDARVEMEAHIALAMLRGLLLEFLATGNSEEPRATLGGFLRERKRITKQQRKFETKT